MHEFGHQPLTGAQVQWGLEHLTIRPAYLKEMWAEDLIPSLTLSCRDHEGGASVKFQQRDGKNGRSSPTGSPWTRRWSGPWWRHRQPSMRRRWGSRCGTVRRRVAPTPRGHATFRHIRAAPHKRLQETKSTFSLLMEFARLALVDKTGPGLQCTLPLAGK